MTTMDRYICVHGHFYQPPREHAWLESIEVQDSAYPYHDWNERITAECYAPNAASRILDAEDRIVRIVSNYSRMSFNFGPTLLAWMQRADGDTYEAVVAADEESRRRFGQGSAMAQPYNHMILPLASSRDQACQVAWGITDFTRRFGRAPVGMWLPEAGVDLATLDVLAAQGIAFTVLAPHQAARVRAQEAAEWRDVADGSVDTGRPYRVELPSGRSLTVFFYHGPVSRAVAFEGLLRHGGDLAKRLAEGAATGDAPRLMHIATDGESYGHHHRNGDMALAYALDQLETGSDSRLINYAAYLERHPPVDVAEILEATSWSCFHGIERWRADCGCSTGGGPGWNQSWRGPLRQALDWLRDRVATAFEARAATLLARPWKAREDYIQVILERGDDARARFLEAHAARSLSDAEQHTVWKLMELQRHAQLMYTSCGWFFDDLSRIETMQILQYAGRAVQLAGDLAKGGNGGGADGAGDPGDAGLEEEFLRRLALAHSNLAEHGSGRDLYERQVRPAMVDLRRVGIHHAVSLMFRPGEKRARIHAYAVDREEHQVHEAGRARLATGRVRVTSSVTREQIELSFGILHLGDHNLTGGVRAFQGEEIYPAMLAETSGSFDRGDIPEVVRALDKHFPEVTTSLSSLFQDEQRDILGIILKEAVEEAETGYRQIYRQHAVLMRHLAEMGGRLPEVLAAARRFVLEGSLRQAFSDGALHQGRLTQILEEAARERVQLDTAGLGLEVQAAVEKLADELALGKPGAVGRLGELEAAVRLVRTVPFDVNLRRVQDVCYRLWRQLAPGVRGEAGSEAGSEEWRVAFTSLGEALNMQLE